MIRYRELKLGYQILKKRARFYKKKEGRTKENHSYTARLSTNAVRQIFGNRVISNNDDIHRPRSQTLAARTLSS